MNNAVVERAAEEPRCTCGHSLDAHSGHTQAAELMIADTHCSQGDGCSAFDPEPVPTHEVGAQGDQQEARVAFEAWWESQEPIQPVEVGAVRWGYVAGYKARASVDARLAALEAALRRIDETTVISDYGAFVPDGSDAIDVRQFAHAALSRSPAETPEGESVGH